MEGKMVLDPQSESLYNYIKQEKVPQAWNSHGDLGILNMNRFISAVFDNISYVNNELSLFKSDKPVCLSACLDPGKFLDGCKLLYCEDNGVDLGKVIMYGTLMAEVTADCYNTNNSSLVFVTGTILEFVQYCYETEAVGPSNCEYYQQNIPCLKIEFVDSSNQQENSRFLCPVYQTPNRRFCDGSSSFMFHLGLNATVPHSQLIKAGAAILIKT